MDDSGIKPVKGQPSSLSELTESVCAALGCVGALVTQVREDRQLILAHAGMELPQAYRASTPLDLSICQHAVAMDFPLAIDDTIYHPLLRENRAFSELSIAAYLGAPVHVKDGRATGAICAFETRQRRWSEQDIAFILSAAMAADRLLIGEL